MTGSELKQIVKLKGLTQQEAADLLGISRQTLNTWCKLSTLPEGDVLLISHKIGLDVNNIYKEPIEILQKASDVKPVKYGKSQLKPILLDDVVLLNVPLVQEFAYAGYMSGYSDETYLNDLPTIPFIADKQYKGTYMAFQVRGDSMDDGSYNSYLQGDIVLCREINQSYWKHRLHINKWDFVIVHRTEGILLKKISEHDPETGRIVVHSLNALYDDMELNLNDVAQLFNVVKVERKK